MIGNPKGSSERGASAMLVAMSLVVLIGGAALAVDIGALWLDRSTDQKITDSAAAAGALEAVTAGGEAACEAALAYVAENAPDITSIDDSGCATEFSASCTAGQFYEVDVNSGQYTIRVTYPVSNGDSQMTSGMVGAGSQALDSDDGIPCERLAVKMEATRSSLFAQLLGFDQGTTRVHTVATATNDDKGPPINLLVLDRTGCQTIDVQGQGGIIVDAVIEVDDMGNPIGLTEGIAASDSDGSAGCMTDGVIDVDGSNSLIRADGPEGCPAQSGTHAVGSYTAGEGCGLVQVYAPGTPGCNPPACTAGGGNEPEPPPTSLTKRLTRERADHKFNCYPDYEHPPFGVLWATDALTGELDQKIDGCDTGDPSYIYDLIEAVGSGPGNPVGLGLWESWSASHPCDVPTSYGDVEITGNVVFDCPTSDPLTLRVHVTVNGNAVFDGDVDVTSSDGHLDINNSLADPGWAFFRGGTLAKDGSAHLTFNYTTVYMSKSSRVNLSGGAGSLTWIAPDSAGPGFDFNDLALWSDSPMVQNWAGQANLTMEGIFFMPLATADYSGGSGMNQTNAQWIADRLTARGNGRLQIRPSEDRGLPLGEPTTTLIR